MNLLVTGSWQCTSEQLDAVRALGHDVVLMPYEKDALPCAYDLVEGVICNGLFLTHPIEKFARLKYIQLTSAGYDRVPMDYVREHGIEIRNAGGVYSVPMAEFALCGVLQLYKQSRYFYENQKQHKWEKHRSLLELSGKTVTVVGCGSVGTACAKRFGAFGCSVVGVDLFPRKDVNYAQITKLAELDGLLPKTDILVLTLPLTESTHHLIDRDRLCKLKPSAILINISRGAVVDTDALIEALHSHLGGAVLDVFEEEPLAADSRLWDIGNALITPHNSFVGDGNGQRLFEVILSNLEGHRA
ncbi:MAG: hydroxyacid dehydrogenase [Clostridia bacterium]|nr:hydroxyacid dehydrogenase [Clostridia bacterium]